MTTVEGLATIHLREDGIAVYEYVDRALVDLDGAKRVVAAAAEVTDRPRPSLILMQRVARVTREARSYFSDSPENKRVVSRAALVVGTPLSRTIGNFFLGLNRTDIVTRLFGSTEEALAWLGKPE